MSYRLIIPVLIVLLILSPLTFTKATKALLNVTITWDIIADGVLENATLDVTVPKTTANQKIIFANYSDKYVDISESDSKIRFEFSGIRAKRIVANFIIQTDYIRRNNLQNNEDLTKYKKETKYIVINDEIIKLSESFASQNLFDLYEMQKWIYNNIQYNSSYTDVEITDITLVSMPSDWVLKKRTGVCDEFSNLLASLARAKGYPTRVIIGYVYIDRKWIPHAWVEVFIPQYGWVEIDPTHNQFMNLNALRVRTGHGPDISSLQDSISATSRDAKGINLEENVEIKIINYTEEEPFEINVLFSPQPPLDQSQPVIIKLRNKEEYPIFTTVTLIPPISVECNNCSRYLILEPTKTEEIEMKLKLLSLNPNIKYTFPNTIITDYKVMEASFERVYIEPTLEERYKDLQSLPNEFQIFIGLFVVAAVALVAIAILLGL
ncbi:MAG: transglutaminase-like domain-containing protein [Candidatus Micrarchaeota archaeon]|nr:transglutaminase-like domain-containing protein [Candidatus Micrarchaeota archaeon]